MDKKNLIILSISVILLISIVYGFGLSKFENNLVNENLTFSDSSNITKNLSVYRYANITSAIMNFSGFITNEFTETSGDVNFLFEGEEPVIDLTPTSDSAGQTINSSGYNFLINYTITMTNDASSNFTAYVFNNISRNIEIGKSDSLINGQFPGNVTFKFPNIVDVSGYEQIFVEVNKTNSDASRVARNSTSTYSGGDAYDNQVAVSGDLYFIAHFNRSELSDTFLEVGTPDGDYEWNVTGVFNTTHNKTDDFASELNTALSNSCSGGVLVGNNCSIPFLMGSATAGILEYFGIDINYNVFPFVELITPTNNSDSSRDKDFECNATNLFNSQLINFTLQLWNSTNDLINQTTNLTSGITNSTIIPIVFNYTDTYHWNCFVENNDSARNYANSNFTLNVDLENPVVNLNYPTNNTFTDSSPIFFNYTPEHSTQTIETCELYGDFTGTFGLNQTDTSITEDVINQFNLSLTDNQYLWNVKCNATETGNSAFALNNLTFTIDSIFPNVTLNAITIPIGSQTITFNSTINDTNLNTCFYSIFNSSGDIDGLNSNITFACGDEAVDATTTAFASYNLTIYGDDLAGNENSSTLGFTTSASVGSIVTGGSSSSTTILKEALNFSILSISFGNKLDLILSKDSVKQREGTFVLVNGGIDEIDVEISCDTTDLTKAQINKNLNICDFVELNQTKYTLSPNEIINTRGSFLISTPPNSSFGDIYAFNLLATKKEGSVTEVSKLSVSARLSLFGLFLKWSFVPLQGETLDEEKNIYPVAPTSAFGGFIVFLIIFFSFRNKLPAFSVIGGIISAFLTGLLWTIFG
tara:strand:- start:1317 stop:3758 length:2442 start_codon:yes stop_codon:yes gene_type:complete